MHRMKLFFSIAICAMTLSACGGGSEASSASAARTLQAGQSVTLGAGETVNVPAGTTVKEGTNTFNIFGHNNQVHTYAGAIVTVAASATGPADNVVTTK
jgi:hypothetical protein